MVRQPHRPGPLPHPALRSIRPHVPELQIRRKRLRAPRSAHTRQENGPSTADPLLEPAEEQGSQNRSTSHCARHAHVPQWHAAVLDLQQFG